MLHTDVTRTATCMSCVPYKVGSYFPRAAKHPLHTCMIFFAREPIYYIRSPQLGNSTLCEEEIVTTERMILRLGGMLAAGLGFRVLGF